VTQFLDLTDLLSQSGTSKEIFNFALKIAC